MWKILCLRVLPLQGYKGVLESNIIATWNEHKSRSEKTFKMRIIPEKKKINSIEFMFVKCLTHSSDLEAVYITSLKENHKWTLLW